MRNLFPVLAVLALGACSSEPPPPDTEEKTEIPFEGDTAGGTIPELPEGSLSPEGLIDAGPIVVDTTCCQTHFRIDDTEPADATGRLTGSLDVFQGGIALSRDGGAWTASLCFPVNTSASYRYEFTWDGGVEDGGEVEQEDGGFDIVTVPVVGFSARASGFEPAYADATGDRWNLYSAVPSCEGLDGSVP